MKTPWQTWLLEVSEIVAREAGVGIDDLEDQPYRDWYEDGLTPVEAAEEVLEAVGFGEHVD